jgi:hypothetical protein
MRDLLSNLRDPDYRRRLWGRLSEGTKLGSLVLLACLVGVGGYLTAELANRSDTNAAFVPPTSPVTVEQTVVHTVKGTARVVTEVRKIAVPSPGGRVVTLAGEDQTVLHEVTVARPGRDRVVTNGDTTTVLRSETVELPVTVTTSVDGPARTVTDRTTAPARTVTVTTPTQTATSTVTVTQPPRTVIETTTDTVTTTDIVTTTETVTVTIPCKKPC